MSTTELVGFTGVALAGGGYVPQLAHLVREHCAAGVSRVAFATWLVSSVLIATRAVAVAETVFVVFGGVQVTALGAILVLSSRYRHTTCASHSLARRER